MRRSSQYEILVKVILFIVIIGLLSKFLFTVAAIASIVIAIYIIAKL
jgi:hypothetical protein